MEKLDRLCEAIFLLARKNTNGLGLPIPKVSFKFDHDGSDTPELGDPWTLTVLLQGFDRAPGEEALNVSVAYEMKWEGKGATSEEAFQACFKNFKAHINNRQLALKDESVAIDQVVFCLGNSTDLKTLWADKDPEEKDVETFKGMAEEAERAPT